MSDPRPRAILALLFLVTAAGCTGTDHRAPPRPGPDDLAVAFLLVDGVYGSELIAPHDVVHHTRFHAEPAMVPFTVSPTHDPVVSFEGLPITPDYAFADAPPADVLVVPSGTGSMDRDLADEALMAWVRTTGGSADVVVSLCDGAFVLAAAGLLDGHRCTTYPGDIPRFREMFPHLDVVEGVSAVDAGAAITSAGGARSYDPAMLLVERLLGSEAAQGVARGLVIDWDPTAIPPVRHP